MKFSVEISGEKQTLGALNRFNIAQSLRVSDAVRDSAKEMVKRMRERVPRRTGRLRKSIKFRMDRDGLGAEVGTRSFIARFFEFGTGPHKITARLAKALGFGGTFAASVEHPGQPARPFVRNTYDEEKPRYANRVRKALDTAARQSGCK